MWKLRLLKLSAQLLLPWETRSRYRLSLMIPLQWRWSPYNTSSFYSSPLSSSPSPSSSSPPITSDSLSLLSPPTTHHSPIPQTSASLPTKLHRRWRWSSTLPTTRRRRWWSGISVKVLNLSTTFLVWTIATPLSSSSRGGIWNIVSGIALNQHLSVSCPCRIITSRRFRGLRAVTWWETDHLLVFVGCCLLLELNVQWKNLVLVSYAVLVKSYK